MKISYCLIGACHKTRIKFLLYSCQRSYPSKLVYSPLEQALYAFLVSVFGRDAINAEEWKG